MDQDILESWTVIFLVDTNPLNKIVILKRASFHTFAPLYYTGIGGKIEINEKPIDSAYRELEEETGLNAINLFEFARCTIQQVGVLHYFWGIYTAKELPECNEGDLEWVNRNSLLSKKLIPTTRAVCLEWEKRQFTLNNIFTVTEKVINTDKEGVRTVQIIKIQDGLH